MMKKIIFLFSLFLEIGCIGKGFNSVPEYVQPPPPCDVVAGTCTVTATGNKTAQQQVPFEFDFTSTVAGPTYYIHNAPAWLQVDTVGTKIYGTPTAPATLANIKIAVYDGTLTEEIGPFSITVDGDPLVSYAWHIQNTGQKTFSLGAATTGQDFDLIEALALGFTGLGVKIAVSDEGVEIGHEDLTANLIVGASKDYLSGGSPWLGDPTPTDPDMGHGTGVTGIMVAEGWNNIGTRGMAPNAQYASFNFLESSMTLAMQVDQADGNFDIFNYSYGYPQCLYTAMDDTYREHLRSESQTGRGGLGPIYVHASGNNYAGDLSDCASVPADTGYYVGNSNFDGETTEPYMIVVSATNATGKRASYSSPGANVWVAGLGGEFGTSSPAILSTDLSSCTDGFSTTSSTANSFDKGLLSLNSSCNYMSTMNGTSAATPSVSAVVALILEANPALGWRDVKHIFATTSDVVDTATTVRFHPLGISSPTGHTYQRGWVTNAAGYRFNNHYGFGRVNAKSAVTAAAAYGALLPDFVETESPYDAAWYYQSGTVNLSIPDYSATGVSSTLNVKHNLVVEAVQIRVNLNHIFVTDVGLELTSPSGTKSIILNINSGILESGFTDAVFLSNAFYGESSRGNWTLKAVDGFTDDTGTLSNWSIKVFGHISSTPAGLPAPDPIASITVPASHNSITATPTVTWAASPSTDVMRYEFAIGTTAGAADIVDWQSVGAATSASENGLSLTDGSTYHFSVRAIDTSENVSSVVSDSWLADVP